MIDSVAVSEEMNGTLVLISDIARMLYFAAHAGPLNTLVVTQPHACILSEGEVSPRSFFTGISTQLTSVHIDRRTILIPHYINF